MGDNPSNITFTDDLNAVLPGLTAVGPPPTNICGPGSTITGTSLLTFSGGSLSLGESCTFAVTVQVPAGAEPGEYVNTTSTGWADFFGQTIAINPASDELIVVDPLALAKDFTDDPVAPGSTVNLEFTITNSDPASNANGIAFMDDLSAVLPGLTAVGLPLSDVCGTGSEINGTSLLTLSGGNLEAQSTCTFSVTLQVPPGTPPGTYSNVTGELTGELEGMSVPGAVAKAVGLLVTGAVARASLVVVEPPDLRIDHAGNVVIVSWPTNAAEFLLQRTGDLVLPAWSNVTASPMLTNERLQVEIEAGVSQGVFRLLLPPFP